MWFVKSTDYHVCIKQQTGGGPELEPEASNLSPLPTKKLESGTGACEPKAYYNTLNILQKMVCWDHLNFVQGAILT